MEVLKSAISDLYGALSDGQVQMLTFQKQVFEEMHCAMPKDKALLSLHSQQNKKTNSKSAKSAKSTKSNAQSTSTPKSSGNDRSLSQNSSPSRPKSKFNTKTSTSSINTNHNANAQALTVQTFQRTSSKTPTSKSPHSRKRARDEVSGSHSQSVPGTPNKRRKRSTSNQGNANMVGTTFQMNPMSANNGISGVSGVNGVNGATSTSNTIQSHQSHQSHQNAPNTVIGAENDKMSGNNAHRGVIGMGLNTSESGSRSMSMSTSNLSNAISLEDEVDIDSSSSSEISHASHQADEDLYTFQAEMENKQDPDRTFYSILSYIKTDGYILLNECIKITRRGHPDYTGRVEAMFFEKATKQKKVCVTIFQLASDIPNIHECRILNDDNNGEDKRFHEGKREYVQLVLSNRHHLYKAQKVGTKLFPVGRIHTNKKVTLWFPKRNMQFKAIERKTSGRDVYFCRYRYDKSAKTLTRIDGKDEKPRSDYQ